MNQKENLNYLNQSKNYIKENGGEIKQNKDIIKKQLTKKEKKKFQNLT